MVSFNRKLILVLFSLAHLHSYGQDFQGSVLDAETNNPIEGVKVLLVEDSTLASGFTDAAGNFSLTTSDMALKTITAEKEGYMFFEMSDISAQSNISISLRARKKSAATLRWEGYLAKNNPALDYVQDPKWTVSFKEQELKGDFAPNPDITRRDPSVVLKINGKYYTWYTRGTGAVRGFGTGDPDAKVFPWDQCDIWYATSTDGITWNEEGAAVERGPAGSYDDRSVFTPEILQHEGKYYLVYQAVKSPYVLRVKNTIAMSVADSPNGPWTKLSAPILKPTNNGVWKGSFDNRFSVYKKGDFDSHKVHDPTLIFYKDKFYLYYKGERMGEERFFGQREIRWGVATSDHPEGPYIKSEYNPITNTGHELCIWKYQDGIALMHTVDGPERETIQFAEDGINFEIKSDATNLPHAFGLFREDTISQTNPLAGAAWGLSHVLKWDRPGGWMYIRRFSLQSLDVRGFRINRDSTKIQIGTSAQLQYAIIPVNASNRSLIWKSSDPSIIEIDDNGKAIAKSIGTATVTAKTADGGFEDSIKVIVVENKIEVTNIVIEAESYKRTGAEEGPDSGNHNGVGRTNSGINWVNRGDWVEYDINIPFSGSYMITYRISTPSDNAEIQFNIQEEVVSKDAVPNNGNWDNYGDLHAKNAVFLEKGTQTIKIRASGSNTWQWNMESFVLTGEFEDVSVTEIKVEKTSIVIAKNTAHVIDYNLVPVNTTGVNIQWISLDTNIATVDNGIITGVNPGKTTVKATILNSTIETSIHVEVLDSSKVTAVNNEFNTSLNVWPNPAVKEINIETGVTGVYNIVLYDLMGEIVFSANTYVQKNFKVNIGNLAEGIYLLGISNNARNTYIRIRKK